MEANINLIWERAIPFIAERLSQTSFNAWIRPLKPLAIEDGIFYLETEDDFQKEMIESRHLSLIKSSVAEVSSTAYDFVIISNESKLPMPERNTGLGNEFDSELYGYLNPKYTFDSFVVGAGNRLAHAAAVAVAERPAEAYNPLFLYGGVGLGKTHLMHAIAFEILNNNSKTKVLYVSSETFTNELINAIKHGKNEEFRQKYRNIDVLLIDDIQFIADKDSTQEEFFHTFNTLHEANKQIVVSSDRPPKEIKMLEERLSSRFNQGLISDMKPPDYETRMAILRKKAERYKMVIDDGILEYIAKNVSSNIRELEGALTKVDAYSKLIGEKVNLPLVEKILQDFFKENANRVINAELIIDIVSNHYGITRDEIRSPKRSRAIAHPRQIAMYFCRKLTTLSFEQIGDCFGGKDHTTVMHGCDKITDEIEKNSDLQATLVELEKKIKGNGPGTNL